MLTEFILVLAKYLFAFVAIWTVITYMISPRKSFGNIQSRWQTTFPFSFSTKEFYDLITQKIKDTEIEHINISTVKYYGHHVLFSPHRVYLLVRRGDHMFLICAAPFGKEFFVSWWMGEPIDFIKDLIPRIPKIGPALAVWMYQKTFYRMDTDSMFINCIKNCVNEAVEQVANDQGIRNIKEYVQPPVQTRLKENMG